MSATAAPGVKTNCVQCHVSCLEGYGLTHISHTYLEVHRTSNAVEWETSITSLIDTGLKELEKQ
jgi:hypothetical protein